MAALASNKPVIHGRDHLPGGSDPIPGIVADVVSGLHTGEEHLYADNVVPTLTLQLLDFVHYDGDTLVDLTATTHALVLETGMYACSVSVNINTGTGALAGEYVEASVFAKQSFLAWPGGRPPPSANGGWIPSNGIVGVIFGVSVVSIMTAPFDWFQVQVSNQTSDSVSVSAGVNIARIIAT